MSDIHELLDDAQKKSQALVDEIETFKKSRLLNEKATESLEAMALTLSTTLEEIEPLTENRVRKLTIILLAMGAANTVFFFIILLLTLFGN